MQWKLLAVLALTGLPCGDPRGPLDPGGAASSAQRQYGAPVEIGNGRARTYIVADQKSGGPVEVGVAPSS